MHCAYDTKSAEETRSSALKRDNEILKRKLELAEGLLQQLTSLPNEESLELLKRLRGVGNSVREGTAHFQPTPATAIGGTNRDDVRSAPSSESGYGTSGFTSVLEGPTEVHPSVEYQRTPQRPGVGN